MELGPTNTSVLLRKLQGASACACRLGRNVRHDLWSEQPGRRAAKLVNRLHQYHFYIAIVTGVVWIARIRIQVYGLDLAGKLVTGAIYDLLLLVMWYHSAVLQSAEDISDPAHLSLRPWYLERACTESGRSDLQACELVKTSYVLTWFTM
jgi:hypothetical protein